MLKEESEKWIFEFLDKVLFETSISDFEESEDYWERTFFFVRGECLYCEIPSPLFSI